MTEESSFKIKVRNENYIIETVDLGNELQFKVSTDCVYIMTIYRNEDGNWSANTDVQVMDEELITEIGAAIEFEQA